MIKVYCGSYFEPKKNVLYLNARLIHPIAVDMDGDDEADEANERFYDFYSYIIQVLGNVVNSPLDRVARCVSREVHGHHDVIRP